MVIEPMKFLFDYYAQHFRYTKYSQMISEWNCLASWSTSVKLLSFLM